MEADNTSASIFDIVSEISGNSAVKEYGTGYLILWTCIFLYISSLLQNHVWNIEISPATSSIPNKSWSSNTSVRHTIYLWLPVVCTFDILLIWEEFYSFSMLVILMLGTCMLFLNAFVRFKVKRRKLLDLRQKQRLLKDLQESGVGHDGHDDSGFERLGLYDLRRNVSDCIYLVLDAIVATLVSTLYIMGCILLLVACCIVRDLCCIGQLQNITLSRVYFHYTVWKTPSIGEATQTLLTGIRRGCHESVMEGLSNGACVYTPDENGRTPVMLCILHDNSRALEALLQHVGTVDADLKVPNEVDSNLKSILKLLRPLRETPIIQKLLLVLDQFCPFLRHAVEVDVNGSDLLSYICKNQRYHMLTLLNRQGRSLLCRGQGPGGVLEYRHKNRNRNLLYYLNYCIDTIMLILLGVYENSLEVIAVMSEMSTSKANGDPSNTGSIGGEIATRLKNQQSTIYKYIHYVPRSLLQLTHYPHAFWCTLNQRYYQLSHYILKKYIESWEIEHSCSDNSNANISSIPNQISMELKNTLSSDYFQIVDPYGNNIVLWCLRDKSSPLELVETILKYMPSAMMRHCCHPDMVDHRSRSVVVLACMRKSVDMLRLLVEYGVSVEDTHSKHQESCKVNGGLVHFAIRLGNLEVVRFLLEESGFSSTCVDNRTGFNILLTAIKYKHRNIVRYIVETGYFRLSDTMLSPSPCRKPRDVSQMTSDVGTAIAIAAGSEFKKAQLLEPIVYSALYALHLALEWGASLYGLLGGTMYAFPSAKPSNSNSIYQVLVHIWKSRWSWDNVVGWIQGSGKSWNSTQSQKSKSYGELDMMDVFQLEDDARVGANPVDVHHSPGESDGLVEKEQGNEPIQIQEELLTTVGNEALIIACENRDIEMVKSIIYTAAAGEEDGSGLSDCIPFIARNSDGLSAISMSILHNSPELTQMLLTSIMKNTGDLHGAVHRDQEHYSTPMHGDQEHYSTPMHRDQEHYSTPMHRDQEHYSTPMHRDQEHYSTPMVSDDLKQLEHCHRTGVSDAYYPNSAVYADPHTDYLDGYPSNTGYSGLNGGNYDPLQDDSQYSFSGSHPNSDHSGIYHTSGGMYAHEEDAWLEHMKLEKRVQKQRQQSINMTVLYQLLTSTDANGLTPIMLCCFQSNLEMLCSILGTIDYYNRESGAEHESRHHDKEGSNLFSNSVDYSAGSMEYEMDAGAGRARIRTESSLTYATGGNVEESGTVALEDGNASTHFLEYNRTTPSSISSVPTRNGESSPNSPDVCFYSYSSDTEESFETDFEVTVNATDIPVNDMQRLTQLYPPPSTPPAASPTNSQSQSPPQTLNGSSFHYSVSESTNPNQELCVGETIDVDRDVEHFRPYMGPGSVRGSTGSVPVIESAPQSGNSYGIACTDEFDELPEASIPAPTVAETHQQEAHIHIIRELALDNEDLIRIYPPPPLAVCETSGRSENESETPCGSDQCESLTNPLAHEDSMASENDNFLVMHNPREMVPLHPPVDSCRGEAHISPMRLPARPRSDSDGSCGHTHSVETEVSPIKPHGDSMYDPHVVELHKPYEYYDAISLHSTDGSDGEDVYHIVSPVGTNSIRNPNNQFNTNYLGNMETSHSDGMYAARVRADSDDFVESSNNGASLIRSIVNVQSTDGQGLSAFMLACIHDELPIARCLLDYYSDVNLRSATGCTAVMLTTALGLVAMTKWLIQTAKVDIFLLDNNGCNVLNYCARFKQPLIMRAVLHAYQKHKRLVKKLRKRETYEEQKSRVVGASDAPTKFDPNLHIVIDSVGGVCSNWNETLDTAYDVDNASVEINEHLHDVHYYPNPLSSSYENANETNSSVFYKNALMVSIEEGDIECIKLLLLHGADINGEIRIPCTSHNSHTKNNPTASYTYVYSNNENGGGEDESIAHVNTPLSVACQALKLNVIEYMVTKGGAMITEEFLIFQKKRLEGLNEQIRSGMVSSASSDDGSKNSILSNSLFSVKQDTDGDKEVKLRKNKKLLKNLRRTAQSLDEIIEYLELRYYMVGKTESNIDTNSSSSLGGTAISKPLSLTNAAPVHENFDHEADRLRLRAKPNSESGYFERLLGACTDRDIIEEDFRMIHYLHDRLLTDVFFGAGINGRITPAASTPPYSNPKPPGVYVPVHQWDMNSQGGEAGGTPPHSNARDTRPRDRETLYYLGLRLSNRVALKRLGGVSHLSESLVHIWNRIAELNSNQNLSLDSVQFTIGTAGAPVSTVSPADTFPVNVALASSIENTAHDDSVGTGDCSNKGEDVVPADASPPSEVGNSVHQPATPSMTPVSSVTAGNSTAKRFRKRKNKAKRKLKLEAAAVLAALAMEEDSQQKLTKSDPNSKLDPKETTSNKFGFFHYLTSFASKNMEEYETEQPSDVSTLTTTNSLNEVEVDIDNISIVVNITDSNATTGVDRQAPMPGSELDDKQNMSVLDFNEKCIEYLSFRLGATARFQGCNGYSAGDPTVSTSEFAVFDNVVLMYLRYMLHMMPELQDYKGGSCLHISGCQNVKTTNILPTTVS